MTYLLTISPWNRFSKKIYSLVHNYNYFFTILLFVGFIVSTPFTYFVPSIRYLAVSIIFGYLFINIFTNYWKERKLFLFQIFLILYIYIQHFLNQIRDFDSDLAVLLSMLLATAFIKNIDNTIKILKFLVVVNFIAMVYEVISFEYIINMVEGNKYEFGRMQGLFSYSKETGYFLLITFVFLRYFDVSMFYKIILILSAIMSGSRTAIIAILFILFIDYIYQIYKKINYKQFIYFFITVTILILFTSYYFTDKTEYMLFRILSSFDFETSSQQHRLYYWNFYFESLNNYSIFNWIFGNGTYLNHLIGNGSENTYLMIISQMGLIGLSIFLIPIFLVIILFFKKPFRYYPFLVLFVFLFVGRIGIGWADGILMWIMIYILINNNYTYNKRLIYEF